METQLTLFGIETKKETAQELGKSRRETFEDYDGFVDKFKAKLTTDDCYTPEPVYKAVLDFVGTITDLTGKEIVRTAFTKHFGYPLTDVKDPEKLVELSELGGSACTLLYRGEAFLKIEREVIEVDPFLTKPEFMQVKISTRYTEL